MKHIVFALIILLMLAACSAKSETPAVNPEQTPVVSPADTTGSEPVATTSDVPSTTTDKTTPTNKTEPQKPKEITPLVTFIELGAESCIPCRMMQPIMKEIQEEYGGLVKVVFYDLYKERWAAQQYKVRVMPTQVFLDMEGREFFRHEGFFPKADIEKMLADRIGVTKPRKD